MRGKVAKNLRKIVESLYADKPSETRYIVLRSDTPNHRQFKLYDCKRFYYQHLKNEVKTGKLSNSL